MKNSAGFYTTSNNCAACGGEEVATALFLQRDVDATGIHPSSVCEWHHASGNRLAFFAKDEEEIERIEALRSAINEIKNDDLPKNKAAVWRGLVDNDQGFGGVEYKKGKFGRFVCLFGKPDGKLYFPSEVFAERAKKLLKI